MTIRNKFYTIIKSKQILIWILLIIIIDYSYTVTITYDSAHYFSLVSILSGNTSWAKWAPIRGIVFPLLLQVAVSVLGKNVNSLLAFYTFMHCVLFYCLNSIIINKLNITKVYEILIVRLLIFIFIITDPIIFGYYHVILTEAVAATILTLSVLLSYKFYQRILQNYPFASNHKYLAYYYFFVPFCWHLKQPFVIIPLLPLIFIIILILQKTRKIQYAKYFGKHLLLILITLGSSIGSWDLFLQYSKVDTSNKTTESEIKNVIERNFEYIGESPLVFGKAFVKNYLAISNIYYFNQKSNNIEKNISFIRGSENEIIGYRMYTYGYYNTFPIPENLMLFVEEFSAYYNPPIWLNNILNFRRIPSNFMFSFLYLLLPFFFLYFAFCVFKGKDQYIIDLLGTGTIIGNASIYSLTNLPIDRYLLPGYPLLILFSIIYVYKFIKIIILSLDIRSIFKL